MRHNNRWEIKTESPMYNLCKFDNSHSILMTNIYIYNTNDNLLNLSQQLEHLKACGW